MTTFFELCGSLPDVSGGAQSAPPRRQFSFADERVVRRLQAAAGIKMNAIAAEFSSMEGNSFIGGIVYPRDRGPLARGRVSWQFARLTLDLAGVTFSPRGWIQRFVRPITVPYKDLTRVERLVPPSWLHFAEGLRFRSRQKSWDRLYFSASPRRIAEIVELSENAGLKSAKHRSLL